MNLPQFEQHVRQHQDRVFGFALYLLRDREEAADVSQEVLIRLWKHRQEVDEERLVGWLMRVTRNACIDAIRRRKAYRSVMAHEPDGMVEAAGAGPTPEQQTSDADFRALVEQALDGLSEPYRSIVALREIQGLKYEEICGAMDLPLNTVKVYLHRGRKRLRAQLSMVSNREYA